MIKVLEDRLKEKIYQMSVRTSRSSSFFTFDAPSGS